MPIWLWQEGHIAWPLFGLIAWTLALLLSSDFAWRMLVMPIRWLALCAVGAWIIGAAIVLTSVI